MGTEAPVMTLRDTILFPGAEGNIYVGREATLAAVRRARAQNGNLLAVFTQRWSEKHLCAGAGDVYAFGTLCRIEAGVDLQDNSMKLLLVGIERIALDSLRTEADESLTASYTPASTGVWADDAPQGASATAREELCASITAWQPEYGEDCENLAWRELRAATDLGVILRHGRALIALPRVEPEGPRWLARSDAAAERLRLGNEAVALRQRILEADDAAVQLALMHAALAFDRAARPAAS